MNTLDSIDLQQSAINDFFAELKHKNERLVYAVDELASPENIAAEALAA
jgi:tRNA-dihydrouridine synthase B